MSLHRRQRPVALFAKGSLVHFHRTALAIVTFVCVCGSAAAQQRPLLTEDPEVVGAGRLLIEGGLDAARDAQYPVSGLEGTLWRVPTIGISVGLSSIAELQIDGGFFNSLAITHRRPRRRLSQ
jgi:hypothetical protein